jgi:hypothetical protein
MDGMTATVPDLLRRFVPTPHGGAVSREAGLLWIESNDEFFAMELLDRLRISLPGPLLRTTEHIKVVIEDTIAEDGDQLMLVETGLVRTLLRGTTTVLICDFEERKIFAFLPQTISCDEFLDRLLPALLFGQINSTTSSRSLMGITNG